MSVGALTLGLTTYLQGFVINGTWYLLQQGFIQLLGELRELCLLAMLGGLVPELWHLSKQLNKSMNLDDYI